MRGPQLFQRHLFWRGLRFSVLLRLAFLVALFLSAEFGGAPFELSGALAPALIALTMLVGWLESLRVSERVFLANLGVSVGAQSLWLGLGALAAELVIALLMVLA